MLPSLPRLARILGVALIVTLGGCVHLASRQQKEASFAPFAAGSIGGINLRDFLEQRTGVIVAGAEPVGVETRGDEVGVTLRPPARGRGGIDIGSATAISSDGYYLTARHCVRLSPLFLLLPGLDRPRVVAARLVWKGPDNDSAADVAILKADTVPPAIFEWAPDPAFRAGASVVTAGCNGVAGGHVTQVVSTTPVVTTDEPAYTAVLHNAPLAEGDSGGPLTTTSGQLIGIEILARGILVGPLEGVALRPDPQWVRWRIESDRLAHPATRPAPPPAPAEVKTISADAGRN